VLVRFFNQILDDFYAVFCSRLVFKEFEEFVYAQAGSFNLGSKKVGRYFFMVGNYQDWVTGPVVIENHMAALLPFKSITHFREYFYCFPAGDIGKFSH